MWWLSLIALAGTGTVDASAPSDPLPSWLEGCWVTHEAPSCREVWAPTLGGTAMGHAVCEGDSGVSWEHLRLGVVDGSRALVIHPKGQAKHVFPEVAAGPAHMVFADPAHDFPRRIVYRRGVDGPLVDVSGTPEGRDAPTSFTLRYSPCDAPPPPSGAPTTGVVGATCTAPDAAVSRELRRAGKADAKDRKGAEPLERLPRQQLRRGLALGAVASGAVCTPEDAWHAGLLLQRGGLAEDRALAFGLLQQACDAGYPSACPHAAGAWDVWLVGRGAAPWFGAVYKGDQEAACLVGLDPESTDASRAQYGVPRKAELARAAWRRLTGAVPQDASYEALVSAGRICPVEEAPEVPRIVPATPAALTPLEAPVEPVDGMDWGSVQEALTHGQLDVADRFDAPLSADEQAFVAALKQLLAAQPASALEGFLVLAEEAEDEALRGTATALAMNLLYDQQHLDELASVLGDGGSGDMVRALATFPPMAFAEVDGAPLSGLSVGPRGHPSVRARAGGVERDWMFDTGAGLTTVAASVASELGLVLGASISVGTSTGDERTARIALLDELVVGSVAVRNVPVLVFPDEDLTLSAGGMEVSMHRVIGWPVIRALHAELDYAGGTYVAELSEGSPAEDPNLVWVGYPVVRLLSDTGQPLLFGLDTGSATTSITEGLLGKIDVGPVRTERASIGGVGGFAEEDVSVIDALGLVIGDVHVGLVGLQTESSAGAGEVVFFAADGVLGSDVARGGRLVIDPPRGVFRIEPPGD